MRSGFKFLRIVVFGLAAEAIVVFGLAASTTARADSPDDGVLTPPVRVEAAAPDNEQAERALEQPAFVTVVRVDHHRDETRSTAEVLAESAGVNVRSLGGLGAFASISMRGASTGQTEILIDGVPLSRVAFSSVDIGSLDLGTFDEVEVFRGGVPVALGGDALGGAVNFVTRVGPSRDGLQNEVTLGGGSFGARRARVSRGDAFDDGKLRTTFALGYAGATGDFDYFDDNGTPLNLGDDHTRKRQNDGFDQLDAVARAAYDGPVRLSGGERFSTKQQGVPGPTGVNALHASLDTTRDLVDVAAVDPGLACGALTLGARGYALVETQRFRDPMAEVGNVVADDSYLTLTGGAAVDGRYTWSEHQAFTAAVDARWEHFTQTDDNTSAQAAEGTRFAGGVSVGDEVVFGGEEGEDFVLLPAVRLDLATTRGQGAATPNVGVVAPADRDDAFVSPRLGARWRVTPTLTLKANLGRYFRAPTVIELFGDRGFVAGNGALSPETGSNGDLGFVFAPGRQGALDRLYLEVAGFGALASDLIVFLPTAGHYARAANLADARTAGVEAALSARVLGAVTLTGSYTFLATEQRSPLVSTDGKALPGRPRHSLYLRSDVARRAGPVELGVFADLTLISGNFLDEGNLDEVPLRKFVGAGVRVSNIGPLPGVSITVEVRNLFDDTVEHVDSAIGAIPRAVADVLDYPLPGRAFYGAVDFNF